ncbi:G-D-S-L family lipolytic protein [Cellulophaga sp. HaHaR_3_176]|uniref:GDSL-type esterase/lipase family protein n=1 Tax=Cellulophaga sp. HaHaR_3_176 TaxID=1942464 RepID=UPI001C1F7CCF|nr:GDSL-type esterase/lipase family protein [Cellulophaga sp. HaHaR_3_176]QWX82699.1 G-D-S-L family lipolytic protein [Cellulophaga sp. HaHaR_3_176]
MKNFLVLLLLLPLFCNSQKNSFFKEEVLGISKKYDTLWNSSRETIVFTGSSSIRLWRNLQDLFPEHQIVNSGFGGSQAIDLLGYTDDLILRFKPKKVFIYEGDNDISSKKRPNKILKVFSKIIAKIKTDNKATKIVLISPKPSIARQKLQHKYIRLNRKLKRFCESNENIEYANVWDIMFDSDKKLKTNLFISDGLHMNEGGYELWHSIIKNYMDN